MLRILRHSTAKILLGLGLVVALQGQGPAQTLPGTPAAPPASPVPSPAVQVIPSPSLPTPPALPIPPAHPTPPAPTPPALTPQVTPTHPVAPAYPDLATSRHAVGASADVAETHPAAEDEHAEGGDSLGSENTTSAGVNILGRADFLNRFNLFDNMSALPEHRIWFGFQALDKFQAGFGSLSEPGLPLTQHRNENLYRGGGEFYLGSGVSVIAEGQYAASSATTSNNDAWTNPIVMIKWAVINTRNTVVSPILAYSPEISQSQGQLHESTSRILPGVLFFQTLGGDAFLQGGMQFNFATGDASSTFDYVLSLGYWLYRDPSLSVSGRRTDPFERTAVPFITGLIPQIEILGKNVINNYNKLDFSTDFPGQSMPYPPFQEGQNVYDMTVGCTMLMFNHVSLNCAYSFPISGVFVRKNEFLSYLNVNF